MGSLSCPIRRAKWIVSTRDLTRIPFKHDNNPRRLIGSYTVERDFMPRKNSLAGELIYITWRDKVTNVKHREKMSRAEIVKWVNDTAGETPPPIKVKVKKKATYDTLIDGQYMTINMVICAYHVTEHAVRGFIRTQRDNATEAGIIKRNNVWLIPAEFAHKKWNV